MCTRNGVVFEAAFDCFPRSNYIDVVKGDAEEYTALIGYADRLLAFKTNTLYIINVAGTPTEWFLESEHKNMGVKRPCQAIKTEDGVMWANGNGAFVYTGGEVRTTTAEDLSFGADIKNLSRSLIDYNKWLESDTNMAVFYIYKKRQFGVLNSTTNINGAAYGYIYDFTSNTWSEFGLNTMFTNTVGSEGGGVSNFIINHTGDITWARNVNMETQVLGGLVTNGAFNPGEGEGVDGTDSGWPEGTSSSNYPANPYSRVHGWDINTLNQTTGGDNYQSVIHTTSGWGNMWLSCWLHCNNESTGNTQNEWNGEAIYDISNELPVNRILNLSFVVRGNTTGASWNAPGTPGVHIQAFLRNNDSDTSFGDAMHLEIQGVENDYTGQVTVPATSSEYKLAIYLYTFCMPIYH